MAVTLAGSVTDTRHVHSQKACPPMSVTPSGTAMDVRLQQCSKALLPMLFTLPGITSDVRLWQAQNAFLPMEVIPLPIITVVIDLRQDLQGVLFES
jgi:hypothetical protein